MAIRSRSRTLTELRTVLNDALYRGSLILIMNTAVTSGIGFIFWTLAARTYPASTVGVFSSVTSGVVLLAAVAALGLPNTMIRHVASVENARELVIVAVTAIATVGTALCFVTVLALGPHLPPALHLQQRGVMVLLVTMLVVITAVSSTLDAGLVATRASHVVLIKNLIGSLVKLAALFLLTSFRSSGLLLAYGLGLVLATALSGVVLGRRLGGKKVGFQSFLRLRNYLSITSGNYVATIMGILPLTVVPLEVLVVRGATETARFAAAFLMAGFLNFIPSTVAQVLFAEASRRGMPLGRQLRKAIRGVYALLLPAVVIMVPAAPLLLSLFGAAYATAATGCLRVLALSTLLTGGTYLVDSLLIARDRTGAYVFMNGVNAALVLGCVGILLPRGLTAAAAGWALGQGLSLVLGLIVLATGTVGRHHPTASRPAAENAPQYQQIDLQPQSVIYAFEPQIRELLATWPLMPITLIAERVGWDQSLQVLLELVAELRSAYSLPHQQISPDPYLAGEIAQCGLWFPPTEVPVGFGQTRSAQQLPVLTMITGYSGWLTALLIPSTHAEDLLAGLWELLATLGGVPQELTWDSNGVIGRMRAENAEITAKWGDFCRVLGARLITGRSADPETRGLSERAHAYLEHSFLTGRTFASPRDFNAQLQDWLNTANSWKRQSRNRSPAESIGADRQAMLPLPPVPPPTGWRQSVKVGPYPFFRFDSNDYSLHPAVSGHWVEVVADLSKVRALCEGKMAADHDRAWAHNSAVRDPAHAGRGWLAPPRSP